MVLVYVICLERDRGIEPLFQPWQGRVLPLYQSRKNICVFVDTGDILNNLYAFVKI